MYLVGGIPGMDEWMKNHLSGDDYNEYCKLNQDIKNLD